MTRSTERHAVVVGAGIGGLAAALGLHRAGWRVTVLERAPRLREQGAGISLLSNGRRALDQLGLGPAVEALSARMAPGGEGLRTRGGRRLQRPADPAFLAEHGLFISVLTRPQLHTTLREALPSEAVLTGAEVVHVAALAAGGAEVRTRDGLTLQADAVIAADGAFSSTRALLWPQLPPPRYSGHSVWRGIAEGVDPTTEPGGSSWGRGLEFGRMPLTGRRVYWFAVANTPEGHRFPDEYAEVRRRFGRWHDPIPALLAATPPERVLRHDVFELAEPLPSFVRGPIALLGDAAHAMTSDLGQGACQALEDAVVLADLLAESVLDPDADPVTALARYDEVRRPRAQGIAMASRRMGETKLTESRVELLRRNVRLRLLPPSAGQQGMAMVGDWQPPAPPVLATSASTELGARGVVS
jgi:2-polyprenyl-6-methoxyphenol hydroxylase-like FAD-dependent oxidoreductase